MIKIIFWSVIIFAGLCKLVTIIIARAEASTEVDTLENDLSERYDSDGNRRQDP